MNTKICTSIEQSKKLLNLGLDPSTADMCYASISYDSPGPYCEVVKAHKPDLDFNDLPCWSLVALLELMPKDIKTNNGIYNFSLVRRGYGAYTFSYIHSLKEPWELGYDYHLTTHKDSVIDAAFEMVCWLIEQGFIKVNE